MYRSPVFLQASLRQGQVPPHFTNKKTEDWKYKIVYPVLQLLSGFPGSSEVKNLPAKQETQVQSLEKIMATHSRILAWRIPMDREAWQATVCKAAKELDMT